MQLKDIREYQWLGTSKEKEESISLRAGKLEVKFCSGRLIDFTYEGKRVLTEVYFALRDQNWNTIPYSVENLKISENEDGFTLTFHARHDSDGISYEWEGRIRGDSENEISYSFQGVSGSRFLKNRIGFCILHPAECAGARCRIIHSDGKATDSVFPEWIAPHQPFFEMKELTYYTDGLKVSTRFDGDIFEMEDQRNWTDASFKTYCTPLGEPFPVTVHPGDEVSQEVMVKVEGSTGAGLQKAAENILDFEKRGKCSGICLGSVIKEPLSPMQQELVRRLQLEHVRYEYHFRGENHDFSEIMDQIGQMQLRMLLAVFFTDNWKKEITVILELVSSYRERMKGILVFQENTKVIDEEKLRQIRDILKVTGIAVGSGTDAFFTQNNREPLPAELMDFVSYSNNPQVHAFDNESMMSTTDGQAANVLSCRRLFRGLPVMVSPVSLKMRWNPDLTAEESTPEGVMPRYVDPRQMSLFAAAWFIRSLVSLIESGAGSADYFELTGVTGIMQSHELPDYEFPAVPDMLYPLYFAMCFVAGTDREEVRAIKTSDCAAICLQRNGRTRIVIANSRDREIKVRINTLPEKVRISGMHAANIKRWIEDGPKSMEEKGIETTVSAEQQMDLRAYEIRVLDF